MEQRQQVFENGLAAQLCGLRFRNDVDVPHAGDAVAVEPEALPRKPFDPVSDHRLPDLSGDGDAQPVAPRPSGAVIGDEIPVRDPSSRAGEPQIIGAFANPIVFGECKPTWRLVAGGVSLGERAAGRGTVVGQAESRLRPRARRRLIIRRPSLVDIRFRNPWVRARLMRLG